MNTSPRVDITKEYEARGVTLVNGIENFPILSAILLSWFWIMCFLISSNLPVQGHCAPAVTDTGHPHSAVRGMSFTDSLAITSAAGLREPWEILPQAGQLSSSGLHLLQMLWPFSQSVTGGFTLSLHKAHCASLGRPSRRSLLLKSIASRLSFTLRRNALSPSSGWLNCFVWMLGSWNWIFLEFVTPIRSEEVPAPSCVLP